MERPLTILLAFDWSDARIYQGIARYARGHGWHIAPYMLLPNSFAPQSWPADGVISCYGPRTALLFRTLQAPVVDITIGRLPLQAPRVIVDNQAIGKAAAEHLLQRGYRHFAYYSWPEVDVNACRCETFSAALLAAGVAPENIHLIHQCPAEVLGLWEAHRAHIAGQLEQLPRPLAVFTGQDSLGAALIEICSHSGISVPEEVAVLGVDNIGIFCESLSVPLSSVDTHLDRLGYEAADQLNRLIRGEIAADAPPRLVPPSQVACRMSTDSMAVSHPGVLKALAFIHQNLRVPIALESLTDCSGLSRRGLEKAFLQYLGSSPAAEIRRIRLEKAKQLLRDTNLKISAVAHECGYSNSSNLSLAFNRDVHMPPHEYREQHAAPAL